MSLQFMRHEIFRLEMMSTFVVYESLLYDLAM